MSLSTGEIFFSLFQTLYRQHYGVSCPHIFLHPIKQKRRERFPWGWHNSFWERSPSSCFNMSNSALPWLQWVCLSLQMETLIYCCSYTHSHMHTLFLGNICFSAITWMQTAWLRKCSRMSMQTTKTADVPVVTVINSLFFLLSVMCFQRQMEGGGPFISTGLSGDRPGMTFCWVMYGWILGFKELWGLWEAKDHSLSILLWLSLGPTHN